MREKQVKSGLPFVNHFEMSVLRYCCVSMAVFELLAQLSRQLISFELCLGCEVPNYSNAQHLPSSHDGFAIALINLSTTDDANGHGTGHRTSVYRRQLSGLGGETKEGRFSHKHFP